MVELEYDPASRLTCSSASFNLPISHPSCSIGKLQAAAGLDSKSYGSRALGNKTTVIPKENRTFCRNLFRLFKSNIVGSSLGCWIWNFKESSILYLVNTDSIAKLRIFFIFKCFMLIEDLYPNDFNSINKDPYLKII